MSGDQRVTGIRRGAALHGIFGYWPSFHDAEVLSFRLDRGDVSGDRLGAGPRLEADVYVFEITDQIEPNGGYRLRHHTIVTMAFYGVDNLSLSGFSHLNELHGIQFRDIRDRGLELLKWDVSFDGSLGMSARFLCGWIAILQVRTLDGPPPGLQTRS